MKKQILMLLAAASLSVAPASAQAKIVKVKPPANLGIPRATVLSLPEAGLLVDAYPTPKNPSGQTIDLYRQGRRVARYEMDSEYIFLKEPSVEWLDLRKKTGLVLVRWFGADMWVAVLEEPYGGKPHYQVFTKSEFSTTGWTDLSLERDSKTGLIHVVEGHFSPGEETEQGRKTDASYDYYDWDPKSRHFVQKKQ